MSLEARILFLEMLVSDMVLSGFAVQPEPERAFAAARATWMAKLEVSEVPAGVEPDAAFDLQRDAVLYAGRFFQRVEDNLRRQTSSS